MADSASKEFVDLAHTKNFYTQWAENYEKESREQMFNGPDVVVTHFLQLNIPKDSYILDVGAGTGFIGKLLAAKGYNIMDALDATPKMLEIAKQKNCYNNCITSYVASDIRLPIEDHPYDVVIMAGVFCPGHISVNALEQIIRVVKPGGIICWSMGLHEEYAERDKEYQDDNFSKHLQYLCDQNKWTPIDGYPIKVSNYNMGNDGIVYVYKTK